MALVVKNMPANAGDVRETGSVSGSGRFSAGGDGNPLQYSCLENPMDRAAWQATVHEVAKSRTRLKRLSTREVSKDQDEELGFGVGCTQHKIPGSATVLPREPA